MIQADVILSVSVAFALFMVLPLMLPRSFAFAPAHQLWRNSHARSSAVSLSVSWNKSRRNSRLKSSSSARASNEESSSSSKQKKGKLLVLGGTGFLGENVCKRALLEGYQVTSLSRRGLPPPSTGSAQKADTVLSKVDYRKGDARKKESISNILDEGGYDGVVHCVGLLFDDASGLGSYNRFVSGSGSLPDADSTYETITRVTAFNAIEAAEDYAQKSPGSAQPLPFVFTSAAEAGWPEMGGGDFIERFLAPDFLKRYLKAKRAVESRLLDTTAQQQQPSSASASALLRPIIVRPSLIYSLDRPASYVPVGAFFVGNKVGLPFVDRPVTVQALAGAIIRAIGRDSVQGVLRYNDIDELNA